MATATHFPAIVRGDPFVSAGGKQVQCGWLPDKFDLSWQIVPTIVGELF